MTENSVCAAGGQQWNSTSRSHPSRSGSLKGRGRRISCNTACSVVSTFVGGLPKRMAAAWTSQFFRLWNTLICHWSVWQRQPRHQWVLQLVVCMIKLEDHFSVLLFQIFYKHRRILLHKLHLGHNFKFDSVLWSVVREDRLGSFLIHL